MLPQVQVDRGAIKFVLKPVNIMCPGLTSPGAKMEVELEAGAVVVRIGRSYPSSSCTRVDRAWRWRRRL